MGCHTWFYNKIEYAGKDLPILKEKLANYFESLDNYPTFYDYIKDDGLYEEYLKMKNEGIIGNKYYAIEADLKKQEKEWLYHCLLRNEMPQKIRCGELSDKEFKVLYKKEYIFYEAPGFSDDFRTFDYETPNFRCYAFAERYLKKHNQEFYIPNNDSIMGDEKLQFMLDVCERFFWRYPNGWIHFG